MMALGANDLMKSSETSFGWISQYTAASRTRRAMSWVTWEPKSRMRTLSCCMVISGSLQSGALAVEEAVGQHEADRLQGSAGEEGQTHARVAGGQMRDPAQQGQADDGREDGGHAV